MNKIHADKMPLSILTDWVQDNCKIKDDDYMDRVQRLARILKIRAGAETWYCERCQETFIYGDEGDPIRIDTGIPNFNMLEIVCELCWSNAAPSFNWEGREWVSCGHEYRIGKCTSDGNSFEVYNKPSGMDDTDDEGVSNWEQDVMSREEIETVMRG